MLWSTKNDNGTHGRGLASGFPHCNDYQQAKLTLRESPNIRNLAPDLKKTGHPMTGDKMREIEQGYEAKFKLDEELRFKARCRRNRLMGHWAAERMGFNEIQALEYAKDIVIFALGRSGDEAIVERLSNDLAREGRLTEETEIVARLVEFERIAWEQITSSYPTPLDGDHVQIGG